MNFVCQQEQVSSQVAEKKLDADEDKQNPAYIPRKGYFYEHDLRIEAEDETANKTEYFISVITVFVCKEVKPFQRSESSRVTFITIFRSTPPSRPNTIIKCPSARPSVRPQKVSLISMKFGM